MSNIKYLKENFSDERGNIIDLFVKQPKEHCSLVSFVNGAVRGNHYHKKSTQFTYILDGKFNFFYAKVDAKGNIISEVNKVEVKPKAFITHKAFEAHSFQLIGKAGIILAFACGVRGGLSYEKDTFRLNQPMHSLK